MSRKKSRKQRQRRTRSAPQANRSDAAADPQRELSRRRKSENDPFQLLLTFIGSFGLGALLYFSGGKGIVETAYVRLDMLRQLRDSGVDTAGVTTLRDRGYTYFDTRALKEIRPSDQCIQYRVADSIIEVGTDTWGSVSDDDLKVRYLPSDPYVSYYTNEPNILQAIRGEIRGYVIELMFVWGCILIPATFGAFIMLATIAEGSDTQTLFAFVFPIVTFLASYIYLVWF
ncbi:MAG: hypothetical protein JNL58_31880 [Planctomyces sp.]|nr:hypothetical protein [Planctomyces sp.]